jgi:molybdopterin-synthase adenylyltransferase
MQKAVEGNQVGNPDRREHADGACLEDMATMADPLGDSQLVVEDAALLKWAESNGMSPRSAAIEAIRRRIVPIRYAKNLHSLSLAEQRRICEGRVLVCGCGGLGGVLINLLARAGVGALRLLDGGVFVPSHLNRQWLCDTQVLSHPKAEVAGARIRSINPLIEVEVISTFMDEHNAESFVEGMDLVIDALDDLAGHFLLGETAKRMKVPFIYAAAVGWWGQISTFLPESFLDMHSVYGHEEEQDEPDDMMGVLGPGPAVIGGLAAFEAIRLLSGRNSAYADQLCYLDGESGRMDVIHLE